MQKIFITEIKYTREMDKFYFFVEIMKDKKSSFDCFRPKEIE